MFKYTLLPVILLGFLVACSSNSTNNGSGSGGGASKSVCVSATPATCESTPSNNGYGNCQLVETACTAPTAASTCALYTTQADCGNVCTWSGTACTGSNMSTGRQCSAYTTQTACEANCTWTAAGGDETGAGTCSGTANNT